MVGEGSGGEGGLEGAHLFLLYSILTNFWGLNGELNIYFEVCFNVCMIIPFLLRDI